MATPSSSATTPSPQLRYLQPHTPAAPATTVSNGVNPDDKEEREQAIQRFLARAELGKLTRGLRTRLSYATFKAMHNLSHNTLHDLENDPQSQVRAKSGNYYNNPATQGNSAMTPGGSVKTPSRKGTMAPPPPVTASAAQSLFSSILAPPPAKRARTIHNPEDPPVPAPTKPRDPSPSPRKGGKSGRPAETAHTKPKSRKAARDKDGAKGKGKQQVVRNTEGSAAGVDIDMKAAATLTSLLLSSRPSISVSASSPRSSLSAGSDAGSTQSYGQYAQSEARTVATAATSLWSAESSFGVPQPLRPSTPPPVDPEELRKRFSQPSSVRTEERSTPKTRKRAMYPAGESGTPHPPSDTEAADSLLFLATSPSPVRASTLRDRGIKDTAGLRGLGGGSGLKGRVLFPTLSGEDVQHARPLRREETGSFASTVSTASSDFPPGGSFPHIYNRSPVNRPPSSSSATSTTTQEGPADIGGQLQPPMEPTVTPPTPTDPTESQLLPAPPSPARALSNTAQASANAAMSGLQPSDPKRLVDAPPTPGNASFNLSDFINVSPSPSASGPPSRLNSHAGIGRRLFEEHHGLNASGLHANGAAGAKNELGVGIDLVKS